MAASAALGLVGITGAATAADSTTATVVDASDIDGVVVQRLDSVRDVTSAGTAARDVCEVYRWGYRGVVFCDSLMLVDWYGDGSRQELFGIDPYRQIWHVWPGAGRWHEMPGDGRADDTYGASIDTSGNRYVSVEVWGSGFYCTADPAGPAGWNGWRRC